jgi:hypothetical protein
MSKYRHYDYSDSSLTNRIAVMYVYSYPTLYIIVTDIRTKGHSHTVHYFFGPSALPLVYTFCCIKVSRAYRALAALVSPPLARSQWLGTSSSWTNGKGRAKARSSGSSRSSHCTYCSTILQEYIDQNTILPTTDCTALYS